MPHVLRRCNSPLVPGEKNRFQASGYARSFWINETIEISTNFVANALLVVENWKMWKMSLFLVPCNEQFKMFSGPLYGTQHIYDLKTIIIRHLIF